MSCTLSGLSTPSSISTEGLCKGGVDTLELRSATVTPLELLCAVAGLGQVDLLCVTATVTAPGRLCRTYEESMEECHSEADCWLPCICVAQIAGGEPWDQSKTQVSW